MGVAEGCVGSSKTIMSEEPSAVPLEKVEEKGEEKKEVRVECVCMCVCARE